ncbi:MAG: GAF domain-containing sensor histidine kinase [Chloroflexia bacterium]|nr:GAF domain-containing sensor histidine kinase [Chloroflexia bacterium]
MNTFADSLSRLKGVTILAPLLFLTILELARWRIAPGFFTSWPGYLLLGGVTLLAVLAFSQAIFTVIERLQRRLRLQNDELLGLHHATISIDRKLDLNAVLQGVVDEARDLFDAKYGALAYLGDDGSIEAFITSGVTSAERRLIGPVPRGHGVLGIVMNEGESLRLDSIADHPRSVGFPPNHPPMNALLAVPIRSQGGVLGNLYIAESDEGYRFEASDEETLYRFAAVAAVAIENARLHRQVQALAITEERQRIAREMHDSLAQVLGYVNTKAQAAQVLLEDGHTDRASEQLRQMAEMARSAYADVREGILSLRTSLDPGRGFIDTLRDYLEVWREQSGVAVSLDTTGLDGHVAALTEVHLLRIVQEALTNIRKHAAATQVHIQLRQESDSLVTTIKDNGVGLPKDDRGLRGVPRFGMSTMRERTESLGGEFDITSQAGQGTCITVRLPMDRQT